MQLQFSSKNKFLSLSQIRLDIFIISKKTIKERDGNNFFKIVFISF